jgi:hypothetical protein
VGDCAVVTFESTRQWRTLFWKSIEDEHPNVITKNTIDVNVGGGGHFKVYDYSQTPFLAVKHDNVCYILNSAYAATPILTNSITQSPIYVHEKSNGTKEEWNTPFYDNFAQ